MHVKKDRQLFSVQASQIYSYVGFWFFFVG